VDTATPPAGRIVQDNCACIVIPQNLGRQDFKSLFSYLCFYCDIL